ncbi:MAG: pilus assembly protein PilM [Planctomycetota bacterium]|nr:pilus assembly protein PilM [Planctomycetota bacterium]
MPQELMTSDTNAPGLLAGIPCAGCGHQNLASRRFCAECGRALRQACPTCGAEGLAGEAFCGACGISLRDLVRQKAEDYAANLHEARRLLVEHQYDEAAWRLQAMAKLQDDSHRHLASQARTLLENLDGARRQAEQRAAESQDKARKLLEQQEYDQAVQVLMAVPGPLRVGSVQTLLEQARARQVEYVELTHRLTEAQAANRLLGTRQSIDRVLELRTRDELAQRLAAKLRDGIVQAVKKKLAAHDYDHARKLLQQVPTATRDEEVTRLETAAAELHWLMSSLQSAAVVDATVLGIGQQLLKLAPTNTAAAELHEQHKRRAAQPKTVPQYVAPNWSRSESKPLGIPVNWLGGLQRLAASSAAEVQLRAYPGRFFVAIGLALQALGASAVTINLAPAEPVTLLGKLSLRRRKSVCSAWGLDLGETSLKAVRLVRQEGAEAVTVETVALIEHPQCLSQTVDDIERQQLVRQVLTQLRERHGAADARVFASLPSNLVLCRAFRLPPIAEKSLAEAVRLEARQQLPYTLEELRWGYAAVPGHDEDSADTSHWDVLVQATRDHHVDGVLSLCEQAGWKVDGVQSDCLALHNFVIHEYFGGDQTRPTSAAIAVLDVGGSSSRLLVSSRGVAWWRGLPIGGETITTKLAQSYKSTRSQAEQLKRTPLAARRLSRLYETIDPCLHQLTEDVERSVGQHTRTFPHLKIEQLFGVGGGFALHGLLRSLRSTGG